MFDFDPRDCDSHDERYGSNSSRGNRGSDDRDRDDDWSQPHIRSLDRGDDARTLGRGPGNDRQSSHSNEHARDRRDDTRWPERDRDHRERTVDPPDAFTRHLNADLSQSLFAIATASTRCAGLSPERWRLWVPFEWSPVVISETATIGLPIRGPATSAISAKKG